MEIVKTNIALVVQCKCGGVVAATMLYGGVEIDADFMDTVAKVHNDGGEISVKNTDKFKVILGGCECT